MPNFFYIAEVKVKTIKKVNSKLHFIKQTNDNHLNASPNPWLGPIIPGCPSC